MMTHCSVTGYLGPISQRDLSPDLECYICGLRLSGFHKAAKSMKLLSLGGSGLKFCKEDLNMAAMNFSPLQNLKWL